MYSTLPPHKWSYHYSKWGDSSLLNPDLYLNSIRIMKYFFAQWLRVSAVSALFSAILLFWYFVWFYKVHRWMWLVSIICTVVLLNGSHRYESVAGNFRPPRCQVCYNDPCCSTHHVVAPIHLCQVCYKNPGCSTHVVAHNHPCQMC